MDVYFQPLLANLPNLLVALLILIIGWLVALIVSRLVGGLLQRTTLDDRITNMLSGGVETAEPRRINVERWISAAVFWLIMLFVIIAFLQRLNLTGVSEPLNNFLSQILGFIPGLLGAAALLFIAWLIATVLRMLVVRVLSASGLARRLSTDAQVKAPDRVTVSQSIGNIVYWLVFLLFLPAILGALNMVGILQPVQRMVDEILGVLPNLLAAALIFAVGWLVARIVRQIVTNLLAGLGIDNLGARAGMSTNLGGSRLSDIIGTIVYVLILIPVAIAALNALDIPAISVPATNMLNDLLTALPALFGAILLIAIAVFVGRLVGRFVAGILTSLGFNNLFSWLGLFRTGSATAYGGTAAGSLPTSTTPADVIGMLVTIAIILFAVMEAAGLLGFEFLAVLVSQFLVAAGQVLAGLVVFAIGLYLSSLAERVIRNSGTSQANILAPAARVAIIIFSGALALRQMGIGEDIVNLAFGLLLGAVAVAAALAFGLGGREVASRQLERWQQSLRTTLNQPPPPPTPMVPTTGTREPGPGEPGPTQPPRPSGMD